MRASKILKRQVKTERGRKEYTMHYLTVPREIAAEWPPDTLFVCKTMDRGILFTPVTVEKHVTIYTPLNSHDT